MAGSSTDWLIDQPRQLAAMARAHPEVTTLLLAGDPLHSDAFHPGNFVHAGVTVAALGRYRAATRRMLRAL